MILKGFFRNILLRVVLITLNSLGLVYVVPQLNEELYFTFIGLFILLLLQVYLLVVYVNKINNNLSYLMESISDENFTFSFKKNAKDGVSDKFQQSVENVKSLLRESKIKHLKKDIYLENIVTHIDIGLFLVDEDEEIDLLNPAAKSLLKIEKLNKLEELEKVSRGLYDIIKKLAPSKPIDIKINIANEILHFLFKVSVFKIDEKIIRLISLQNIKDELERNELSSWQKLIKVFTHEIMNSVTPIVSLAASLQKQFKSEMKADENQIIFSKDAVCKTLDGLETVEDTSKGLLNFVGKYRDLTAFPHAQISSVEISALFAQINLLMAEELTSNNIVFKTAVEPKKILFDLDKNLIELAIINLIKNAITALQNTASKEVNIRAYVDDIDRKVIEVYDNGQGIKAEFLDDIFTPFFSTKEGGTGIGLSLCRQIIRIHNGKIMVQSKVNSYTCFKLIF